MGLDGGLGGVGPCLWDISSVDDVDAVVRTDPDDFTAVAEGV